LIYAIPSDADNILCIDTDESGEESKINGISYLNEGAAFTIGDKIPDTKDKWQGTIFLKDFFLTHEQAFCKFSRHT